MPYVEFSRIEMPEKRPLLPEGPYKAQVEDIEGRKTREGDELWRVTFRVVGGGMPEGRWNGRRLFDNWVFSQRALPRIKLIASAFGMEVGRNQEITPVDFLGRSVEVEVRTRRAGPGADDTEENFIPFRSYRRPEGESRNERR